MTLDFHRGEMLVYVMNRVNGQEYFVNQNEKKKLLSAGGETCNHLTLPYIFSQTFPGSTYSALLQWHQTLWASEHFHFSNIPNLGPSCENKSKKF